MNPNTRCYCDGFDGFDYIVKPKADGYRSVHLIARFRTSVPRKQIYNGQRIEIQIRSKLQHLWATAVETAQVFTGQALKSKFKNATEDWLRFFVLTSNLFAIKEGTTLVPGAPSIREVRHMEKHKREQAAAQMFLLVLDPDKKELTTTAFSQEEIIEAQRNYQQEEKQAESDPHKQVVLVSVDSVSALRRAYPNYYVDTREFITAVMSEVDPSVKRSSAKGKQ